MNTNISFGSIAFSTRKNVRMFEPFTCHTTDKNKSSYHVSITENKKPGTYDINFQDTRGKDLVSRSHTKIDPTINYMFIDKMSTIYSKRSKGLGTCMHLAAIMEMFENNTDCINLYSAPRAIAFHIRMGFKPDGKWEENLKTNIINISKDDTPELNNFKEDANALLKSKFDLKMKERLANKLIYEYTKSAIKVKDRKSLEYMFDKTVPMTLTRKYVSENKDFYNKLFDKYGIDYQI